MNADFGVEVTRQFVAPASSETRENAGRRGRGRQTTSSPAPTRGLADAHSAIHEWAKESSRALAGTSWEIYGDWNDDPAKLETLVMYLLR